MQTVTINLPNDLDEKMTLLVKNELFPNKSELIRTAIRDFLLKYDAFK